MKRAILLSVQLCLAWNTAANAFDFTWSNPAGGNWADMNNWGGVGVPSAFDNAMLAALGNPYTVQLTDTRDIGNITLTASDATLSHSGFLTVWGNFALNAGTYNLSGDLQIAANGGFTTAAGTAFNWTGGIFGLGGSGDLNLGGITTISGAQPKEIHSIANNLGTLIWAGGSAVVAVQNGQGFTNQPSGLIDLTADGSAFINDSVLVKGILTNAGTLRKSSGLSTTVVQWTTHSSGVIDVQAGTLNFQALGDISGTLQGAGMLVKSGGDGSVPAGKTLTINTGAAFIQSAGTTFINGTITGPGLIRLNGGVLNVAPGGQGTIETNFEWSVGVVGFTETGTLFLTGSTTISGSFTKSIRTQVKNQGTMTWLSDSGPVRSDAAAASLLNLPGGLINIAGDGIPFVNNAPGFLLNTGTLRKSGGNSITFIDWTVESIGTIDTQSGVLRFSSLGNFYGTVQGEGILQNTGFSAIIPGGSTLSIANGATFVQSSGSLNVNGTVSGAGLLLHEGGTLDSFQSWTGTIESNFVWTGGAIGFNGNGVLNLNGATAINGNELKSLRKIVSNSGILTWNGGGSVRIDATGSGISNEPFGIIDFAASGTAFTNSFIGTLLNRGTVLKTASNQSTNIAWQTVNEGRIVVYTGTLQFINFTQTSTGSITLLNNSSLNLLSPQTMQGDIEGNGTIIASSIIFSQGEIRPGVTAGRLNVQSNLTLAPTATLAIELGGLSQGVSYDFLNVAGTVNLNTAVLEVRFIDGFESTVHPGDQFVVLAATNLTNLFNNLPNNAIFASADGFHELRIHYTPTFVVLSVVPEPALLALTGLLAVPGIRRRCR